MKEFAKLLEPVYINKMRLRNRIVMPPMHTRFASESGEMTDRMIDYYVERAKGGVGLIILENTCVDWILARASGNPIRIDDDIYTSGLHDLAAAVHEYGAKIATQPHHPGRQNERSNISGGQPPVAPSAIPCKVTRDIPRELTIDEIQEIQDTFVKAALRTKTAGFDAVEIHGAHGYLFTQFASPYSNKRTDLYGGSLENRMRFPVEVVRKVREAVGPGFPIIYRFSAQEKVSEELDKQELEESLYMVQLLEKEGVDAFHVSAGIYESIIWVFPDTPGKLVYLAEAVKKVTNVPVITVGRLGNPKDAEKVLEEGKADLVSMGRAHLAYPYIANKVKSGEIEDIRPCIACNECNGRLLSGWRIECSVNPLMGKEYKKRILPTQSPKKVLIVGAGPAGLEAARVAALRGHKVEVFDKRVKIGGFLLEAAVPSFKQHLNELLAYYTTQLRKLNVPVNSGKEMATDDILERNPDVIILATGSLPIMPDLAGIGNDNVHLAVDVLASEDGISEKKERSIGTNKEICVIGGGEVGLETACFLAEKGNRVTVVEITGEFASELNAIQRKYVLDRLNHLKVNVLTNYHLLEVKKDSILVENKNFEAKEIKADEVIIAVGFTPNNKLTSELEVENIEVKTIGDCSSVGRIFEAIHSGFNATYQL